ncbi:hypothetical protein [Candidatus Accumulibacter sp. ACC003]|uniref:hypothetical protein n=1 Tax=Candidatus Accumulibacter sp. ACC003 TaxID=2823334 RepID=UPI0025C4A908|nr:hypothetical protein [Candidatus Accumulibacter sp. ACC003]
MDHLLVWSETFAADAIVVPAALQLSEGADELRRWGPARRLCAVAFDHLEQRIAEALTPPSDFARASALACSCPHCRDLAAFLADPVRKVWTFKAAEAHCSHVESLAIPWIASLRSQ